MISILMLEDGDTLQNGDWCRPMHFTTMSGGYSDYYTFEELGRPVNNAKWVECERIIGDMWFGKTIGEVKKALGFDHEFVRGDIPESHVVLLTQYEFNSKKPEQTLKVGKYKGMTESEVRYKDEGYYWWAIKEGVIERDDAEWNRYMQKST